MQTIHTTRSTRLSTSPARPATRILINRVSTRIQPDATNSQSEKEDAHIEDRQENLLWAREPLSVIEEQPEDTAKAVREPGGEECGDQAKQVVEDGDRFGDDPGDDPEYRDNGDPGPNGEPGALGHVFGAAEEADVAGKAI